MPSQTLRTVCSSAAARARTSGKAARNGSNRGATAATVVCWSMTSLTQTRYGSRSRRQGRGRALRSNQSNNLRLAAGDKDTRHETGDTRGSFLVSPVSCLVSVRRELFNGRRRSGPGPPHVLGQDVGGGAGAVAVPLLLFLLGRLARFARPEGRLLEHGRRVGAHRLDRRPGPGRLVEPEEQGGQVVG